MKFTQLHASYTVLSEGIRVNVARDAVSNINVRPPSTAENEVDFLRLVTWSYAVLFESGRVSFNVILGLPPLNNSVLSIEKQAKTKSTVQKLRTWLFHNIGFEKDREMEIRSEVSGWFISCCQSFSPNTPEHWRMCFDRLCDDMIEIIEYCHQVLAFVLSSPIDKEAIIATWKKRLQRDWDAHEFDKLISDSALRLGAVDFP
ncbi:hypothetical protein M2404_003968 [Rheinheimera pacifica]|uniref:hypothetical protein n=1 Tax=Rheinheimera pacifica TaxID=173990 RepID=UPI00216722A9|nr:hypothetical protein [Rheinheimera pacifica]MCS4309591.1 hypothetical protein [Rheinheimera pacifica]